MEKISQQEIDALFDGVTEYMSSIIDYMDGEPSEKLALLSKSENRYNEGEYGVIVSLTDKRDRSPFSIPDACNQLIMGEISIDDIGVQPAAIKITATGKNTFSAVMPGVDTLIFHNGKLQEFAGREDIIYNRIAFDWIWEVHYLCSRTEVICIDLRYFLAILPKVGLGQLAKNLIDTVGTRYGVSEEVLERTHKKIDSISLTLVD